MSRISIIVPVYNSEKYLRETLASVTKQSFIDWTCILINDGSTDGSQTIIDSYCSHDNRFVSFIKKNEGSPDLARKFGWEKVETEWVMHLDSDDIIEPTYVEKALKRQEQTGADVVCARIIYNQKGDSFCIPAEDFDMSVVLSGRDAFTKTVAGWDITCAGMLYRLQLTKDIVHGEYINSDEFTFRQMLFKSREVAFVDAKYYCRENVDSISRFPSIRMYNNLKVKLLIEDFVMENYPNDVTLCSKAVYSRFRELVSFASKYWLKQCDFPQADWRKAGVWLREAYNAQNLNRFSSYYPKYRNVFCHGFYWFGLMSVIYELRKRMK